MSRKRGTKSLKSGSGRLSKSAGSARDGGVRAAHKRVKTAGKRSVSSARWLERQLNDPYVAAAKAEGYRSRAAFKLIGLDEQFGLIKRGTRVIDLGAAPGGWTQVAVERAMAGRANGGVVYAVDLAEMVPLDGVVVIQADLTEQDEVDRLVAEIETPIDLVLSDMAASSTGHAATDHWRIIALCEMAAAFAERVLRPGGDFVAKVLQGGAERELLADLKRRYARVKHAKPPASRSDSSESYVVAQGFRVLPRK